MKKYLYFLPKSLIALASMLCISLEGATVIHAGTLLDGTGSKPSKEMSIVIENKLISRVETGYIEPQPDDVYLDLTGYFVLPGLIDMHVHLSSEYSSKSYEESISLSPPDYAIQAVANAQKTLLAGFTTVRNLGDTGNVTVSLRNAINKEIVPGPRIFSSGKTISSSGGHGDPTNSLRENLSSDPGPARGVINSPSDSFKAVRYRYKENADLIKITATGGVLSNAKNGQNPQMTIEEISAVVLAARDYGFKVAAHAHGAEGIKRAVMAGVDSIEHGTLMDAEGMQMMREKGTYYVPTLLAGAWVAEKAEIEGFFPELVRPKALEIGPQLKTTFSKAYQAGVKIAFGTDTGVSSHGRNAEEFSEMVDAGMPELQAILSATKEASILLNEEKNLGSISPGKYADIIAVSESPLENIAILETVDFVMKDGNIYKSP
jgi:imidazolonepropionase-like amidohydrolase